MGIKFCLSESLIEHASCHGIMVHKSLKIDQGISLKQRKYTFGYKTVKNVLFCCFLCKISTYKKNNSGGFLINAVEHID